VVSGRYDEVIISTEPSNVGIYDEGGTLLARSPAKLTFARKDQPIFNLRKEGFQDTTITLKRGINLLVVPLSILPAFAFAAITYPGDGENFGGWLRFGKWVLKNSSRELIRSHLPDYVLGGAWDHKERVDVLMKKKESE